MDDGPPYSQIIISAPETVYEFFASLFFWQPRRYLRGGNLSSGNMMGNSVLPLHLHS